METYIQGCKEAINGIGFYEVFCRQNLITDHF